MEFDISTATDEQLTGAMDAATLVRFSKVDWHAAMERHVDKIQTAFHHEQAIVNQHFVNAITSRTN